MIVDRLYQYGPHTGAVCAQCIGVDLIAHKSAVRRRNAILFKTLADASGKRLFGMSDAVQPVFFTEDLYPVVMTVGHYAQMNVRFLHFNDPCKHRFRWNVGGIRHDGIVKVHHKQPDALFMQYFRSQIRKARDAEGRQQRKGHINTPRFIDYDEIIAQEGVFVHGLTLLSCHDRCRIPRS